ncbi:MAG: GNAT family N-acetyltransferase [Pseudomonadota bacterium]|nr:GNAT family N-acetyltransferase [Pseudomonadota bacterium]
MTITIRRACVADAAVISRAMSDPAIFPGLMQMPYGSEEFWESRLRELLTPGKVDVMLVAERGGELVGSCGLHPAGSQQRRRHAMMLGISVAREAQRSGVGTAMMQALCDYADHWMGALRLELTVFADNVAAIALYRKFGFVTEGRLRGYAMRAGRYEDALTMARIHPAPPAIAVAPPDAGA